VQEYHEQLQRLGYVVAPCSSRDEFIEIAWTCGRPIPYREGADLIASLHVREASSARPNSLSSRYGTGSFPFHTDLAHHRVPPRYVLLRSTGAESRRPTTLKRLFTACKELLEILKQDVWYVNGGRSAFLTNVCNTSLAPGCQIFRFDQHVMWPVNRRSNRSESILREILLSQPDATVVLNSHTCLVVDNWRVLHARGEMPLGGDTDRVIERIVVNHRR